MTTRKKYTPILMPSGVMSLGLAVVFLIFGVINTLNGLGWDAAFYYVHAGIVTAGGLLLISLSPWGQEFNRNRMARSTRGLQKARLGALLG